MIIIDYIRKELLYSWTPSLLLKFRFKGYSIGTILTDEGNRIKKKKKKIHVFVLLRSTYQQWVKQLQLPLLVVKSFSCFRMWSWKGCGNVPNANHEEPSLAELSCTVCYFNFDRWSCRNASYFLEWTQQPPLKYQECQFLRGQPFEFAHTDPSIFNSLNKSINW